MRFSSPHKSFASLFFAATVLGRVNAAIFGNMSRCIFDISEVEVCDALCNQGHNIYYDDRSSNGVHLLHAIVATDDDYNPLLDVEEFKVCMANCLNFTDWELGLTITTDFWATLGSGYERVEHILRAIDSDIHSQPQTPSDMDSATAGIGTLNHNNGEFGTPKVSIWDFWANVSVLVFTFMKDSKNTKSLGRFLPKGIMRCFRSSV